MTNEKNEARLLLLEGVVRTLMRSMIHLHPSQMEDAINKIGTSWDEGIDRIEADD